MVLGREESSSSPESSEESPEEPERSKRLCWRAFFFAVLVGMATAIRGLVWLGTETVTFGGEKVSAEYPASSAKMGNEAEGGVFTGDMAFDLRSFVSAALK